MFATKLVGLAVAIATLMSANVHAAPVNSTALTLRDAGSGTARFVAYQDLFQSDSPHFPDPSTLKGYNVFNMGFHVVNGPLDSALAWQALGPDGRAAMKAKYSAAGIKMMVSVFGGTDAPTTSGMDPHQMAENIQFFVTQNNLDGADVDYEDFAAMNDHTSDAINWLVTFTTRLRQTLPQGQYFISHAPIAPWFRPGGPYVSVHQQVGDMIDWYNVQFYNQGDEYTDCNGLFTQSGGTFPGTSVFEIASGAGVPLNKIVVGKPASSADAGQGNMDAGSIAGCLPAAQAQGWNAGLMVFKLDNNDASFIQAARGSAFPV